MRANCSKDRTCGGWADDWTAALEGPRLGQGDTAASSVPPTRIPMPALASGTRAHSTSAESPSSGDHAALEDPDPFPSPPRMHYCSAAERDEWAAVLDVGEDKGGHKDATSGAGAGNDFAATVAEGVLLKATAAAAPTAAGIARTARTAGTVPDWLWHGRDWDRSDGGGDIVVLAAIELGSHSTRAVFHDGRIELERLTYDTMLGQPASQTSAGSSSNNRGADLHPDALQRTLDALQLITSAVQDAAGKSVAVAAVPAVPEAAGATAGAAGRQLQQGDPTAAAALPTAAVAGAARAAPRIVTRMVATAAMRNASDGSRAALAVAAERLVGCPLEVLTGEDEGRLAWRGVVGAFHELAATPPLAHDTASSEHAQQRQEQHQRQLLLVVDMGGRSTEFVYGPRGADGPTAVSVPLGCVSLHGVACEQAAARAATRGRTAAEGGTGAELAGVAHIARSSAAGSARSEEAEPVCLSRADLEACVRLARETVEQLRGRHDVPWLQPRPSPTTTAVAAAAAAVAAAASSSEDAAATAGSALGGIGTTVIFTGGTITTLAALHQQLPYYERARVHGSVLTSYDIAALMGGLAEREGRAAALASYTWLTEARCRTLAAGCAGLLGVMSALGVDEVVVSDADLLDGLLAEMLDEWRVQVP